METRKFLDDALIVLRDTLQVFFRNWWQDPEGQQWFKKAVSKMKYASGQDRRTMNEADVLVLLNILTGWWETDFGPQLDPVIKKQKLHNYKTFRGKIELLKQYRHDHAHMNAYDIRDVVHRVQDIRAVIEVFGAYNPDVQHHVEKMRVIEKQAEEVWFLETKQKREAPEQGLGADIPASSSDESVQTSPEEDVAGAPDTEEVIAPGTQHGKTAEGEIPPENAPEMLFEDQSTRSEADTDVNQDVPKDIPEDLGASSIPETPPISPNMPMGSEEQDQASAQEPPKPQPDAVAASTEEPVTQHPSVPVPKKGFFSRIFGRRQETNQEASPDPTSPLSSLKTHDPLALRNEILDGLVNVLRVAKNPNQATFKAIHVLVWAAEARGIYVDYFCTQGEENIGLRHHLVASGLSGWVDFPITFEVVSDLLDCAASTQDVLRSKGFWIGTVLQDSNTGKVKAKKKPHNTPEQEARSTCKLNVIIGAVEGGRRRFLFTLTPRQTINIGRKKEVMERGILVRTNDIAFKDTSEQKILHKKHAKIKFDPQMGGFVLITNGINTVAVSRATEEGPIYVNNQGFLLEDGDIIQFSRADVAQIQFTQLTDDNAQN